MLPGEFPLSGRPPDNIDPSQTGTWYTGRQDLLDDVLKSGLKMSLFQALSLQKLLAEHYDIALRFFHDGDEWWLLRVFNQFGPLTQEQAGSLMLLDEGFHRHIGTTYFDFHL